MEIFLFLLGMLIPLSYQIPQTTTVEKILQDCNYRETTDAIRGVCLKKALEAAANILDKGRSGNIGSVIIEPTFFGDLDVYLKEGNIDFNIYARKLIGKGLSQFTFDAAKVDCSANTVELDLTAREIALDGVYSLVGQLLLVKLTGEGEASAVLDDVKVKLSMGLEKRSVGGQEILSMVSPISKFTFNGWKTHFKNLDTDAILDEAFHHFIDNNYNLVIPQVAKGVDPVVADKVGKYIGELYKIFPSELMC